MLIVNNGVPKSGTTLIQKALMYSGKFVDNIGEYQNPKWGNISIDEETIESFLSNYDYLSQNVCLKMHTSAEIFAKRTDSSIKVVTTYRNLMDSVVSMGYHLLRIDREKKSQREHWIDGTFNTPRRYGRIAMRFGLHYLDALEYNSLLIKYEQLVGSDKKNKLHQIFDYSGLEISDNELERICKLTDPGIKSKDDFKENSHVRTGGISCSKDELPNFTYKQLSALKEYLYSENCNADEYKKLCQMVMDGKEIG